MAVQESGPLIPSYVAYLESVFNLDFGMEVNIPGSCTGPVELGSMLRSATSASLGLMALALLLSAAAGLAIGLGSVRNDPPGVARWLTLFSTAGMAMPSFYIGSLFIMASVFYVPWRGPGTQMPFPLDGFGWDLHLVFPTLALMARPTVQVAQVTAALLSGELSKQYVVAARSLGYNWRSIRNQYAMRNVIAPVILTIAGTMRLLVGELILIEWLFRWPGLGRMLAWTLAPPQASGWKPWSKNNSPAPAQHPGIPKVYRRARVMGRQPNCRPNKRASEHPGMPEAYRGAADRALGHGGGRHHDLHRGAGF